MDLDEFVAKYGNHKIILKESNWTWVMLQIGDVVQERDEYDAYAAGWTKIPGVYVGKKFADVHAKMRRRVVTDSLCARTNPLEFRICPVCGNRFPSVITRCAECGHTM